MLTAITGINWGDEGKSRMVDLISREYDIVVRYQGGSNAGHIVVGEQGEFVLNLLPRGILRPEVVNVMGNGMVIDLAHLSEETARLRARGVAITPDNLKISDRASVRLPYHPMLDELDEQQRPGAAANNFTLRGSASAYGDKYTKKALRMGDLLHLPRIKDQVCALVEEKNLLITRVYGGKALDFDRIWGGIECRGAEFAAFICDTGIYLDEAAHENRKILFEAQLGALRDIDFGIYPYTSSSNTIAAYAPIGAGIPNWRLDKSIGVLKAYSTSVNEGPFVTELQGDAAALLRERGHEYGAASGQPRRVGAFDAVASRYGCRIQGADELALTMLDVLSGQEELAVCVSYTIDGNPTDDFPYGYDLERAQPVYRTFKGWRASTEQAQSLKDLPPAARDYVKALATLTGAKLRIVSVGPGREQTFVY